MFCLVYKLFLFLLVIFTCDCVLYKYFDGVPIMFYSTFKQRQLYWTFSLNGFMCFKIAVFELNIVQQPEHCLLAIQAVVCCEVNPLCLAELIRKY